MEEENTETNMITSYPGYEVVSKLGKGSFGEVVQVINLKTKELLALKVFFRKY